MLTNKRELLKGKEIGSSKLVETIDGKEVFQEAADEVPEAIQNAMERS